MSERSVPVRSRSAAIELDQRGFAVIDLLQPSSLARLRTMFEEACQDADDWLSTTPSTSGPENDRRLSDAILEVVARGVRQTFGLVTPIGAAFLGKRPGPEGLVPIHQDWTAVDEREAMSVNVWCALSDVDETSGALWFLPGSHRWFETYRSPTVTSVELDFGDLGRAQLIPAPVRAGQAIVYDHRVFHGSLPAERSDRRPIAQFGLAPLDEPLLMCAAGDDDTVRLHRVGPEAFLRGVEMQGRPGAADLGPVVDIRTQPSLAAADVVARARAALAPSAGLAAAGRSAGAGRLARGWMRRFGR